MNILICSVCGHIAFASAPENCPVCHAPRTSFKQNDAIFTESAEKSKEAAVKHIPVVKVNKECKLVPEQPCVDIIVRVGETLHPMEEAHHIQFIDCYVDNAYVSRVDLTAGVFAAGCFHLKAKGSKVTIVENCNLHGYWKTEASIA